MGDLDAELARHHQAAFGWALACCHWDRSAAEDVLQTAYLKIVDGRAKPARYVSDQGAGPRPEFRAFLFGVIRRTASEERRRRLIRRTMSLGLATEHASDGEHALEPIVRAESSNQLVSALKQLATRQREVLHLVFYNDLTIAEAAEVMHVSLGSARVHYERGKARLRQILGSDR